MKIDPSSWPWQRLGLATIALAGVLVVATTMQSAKAPSGSAPADARPAGLPAGHPPADPTAAPATAAAPHELGAEQMQAMVQRLSERLQRQPDDADGWAMLARTQALSGQHGKAVEAFRKAEKLRPADAVLLADFADALAMTQQRSLAGEPLQLVQRALKLDPVNLKSLSLAGTEAFNRGDFKAAVQYWETLQTAGGPDSVFVKQVQSGIAEARERAGLPAATSSAPLGQGVKVKITRASGS